jgi:hypothetical protein
MPFSTPTPIQNLSADEFKEIDVHVMKAAYAAQNHLGRPCDERLYENDMAETLQDIGCQFTEANCFWAPSRSTPTTRAFCSL